MNRIGGLTRMISSLTVAISLWASGAQAMQFSTLPLDDPGKVVIGAVGEIIPGDLNRLGAYVGGFPSTVRIIGFALDSPGGNLDEAIKIANALRRIQATVGVLGQAKCASACFLIFAAGSTKLAGATALIGVHSASENGIETATSMALTTAMARDAAALGVPPSIIGKMVTAEPGQMEWLTQRDLASMGVNIIQPDAPTTPPPVRSPPPVASLQVAPMPAESASAANQEPVTFQQGLTDRKGWEQWFGSLSGLYLEGASFWADEHRSDHKTPSCYGNGGVTIEVFTTGCLAAQQRLAALDMRRKSDPDYRRGWNSY